MLSHSVTHMIFICLMVIIVQVPMPPAQSVFNNNNNELLGACVNQPCIHGLCFPLPLGNYRCYCQSGFTGLDCQTNYNECRSNPCGNGASCIDGVDSFACVCSEGFTGVLCETDINECQSSPCENGGICEDLVNDYVCYCPLAYEGINCERYFNICETNTEVCQNDGKCSLLSGNIFTCSCPPNYFGEQCELLDCPCIRGGICVYGSDITCLCPFGWTGKTCETEIEFCDEEVCSNKGVCVVESLESGKNESANVTCYCVPDYHGEFCESRYDECLPQSACSNGSTCVDGVDSYSCICPDSSTGFYCNETMECENLNCLSIAETHQFISTTAIVHISISENWSQYTTHLISSPANLQSSRSTVVPWTSMVTKSILSLETSEVILHSSTNFIKSIDSYSSRSYDILPSDINSPDYETHFSSSLITKSYIPTATVSLKSSSMENHSSMFNDNMENSTFSTLSVEQIKISVFSTSTANSNSPYSVLPPQLTVAPISSISLPEICHSFHCENGGTRRLRLTRNNGLHQYECECACKLLYTGEKCELVVYLLTPQFSGHSYLVHSLPQIATQNNLKVDIRFKTSSDSGLIFFTQAVKTSSFLLLHVDAGMLKLSFSCGHQTTIFIETHSAVSNGFFTSATVILTWTSAIPYMRNASCSVKLLVNGSTPMNGEQFIPSPDLDFEHIYIGGLLPNFETEVVDTRRVPAFRGCILSLQVNGYEKDLIYEAEDGAYVTECYSSACYHNPCFNGGTCRNDHDHWFCECLKEFAGPLCEHKTCLTHPCQNEGTCLPDFHKGYLCLCPYGKYGESCEKDTIIRRPSFIGTISDFTSFIEYKHISASRYHFELRIAFTTSNLLQNSLLIFRGQIENSQFVKDFFAVGLSKGYVVYMFNLGSGTRILKSTSTLIESNPVHHILIGRHKRYGWLKLDSQPKIMGLAPGQLTALNAPSHLFVGGHSSFNFSSLPPEVKTWNGFEGCVLDVQTRTSPSGIFTSINHVASGRNIEQCDVEECDVVQCFNGGTCKSLGSSFICECPKGYSGSLCKEVETLCSAGKHSCAQGAECVSSDNGYKCNCPFGSIGTFCEKNVTINTPYFDGIDSFLEIAFKNIKRDMDIVITVQPESDGLLFYATQNMEKKNVDFLSLSISSGSLYYQFNLGVDYSRTTVLTADVKINRDEWLTIRFGRYKRAAYLQVNDDVEVSSVSPEGKESLDVTSNFFIGGFPAMSSITNQVVGSKLHFFKGCLKYLNINEKVISFNGSDIIRGRNIRNCHTSSCEQDPCQNNGSCMLQDNNYKCICSVGFSGDKCEISSNCYNDYCLNGGTCIEHNTDNPCYCPIGWMGKWCEIGVNVSYSVYFMGNSFFHYKDHLNDHNFTFTNISFAFSTNNTSGLLFWNGKAYSEDGDYLGVGIQSGRLYLVWSLGWKARNEIVTNPINLNFNQWNNVHVYRFERNLTLLLNDQIYNSYIVGNYQELNTQDFYFGGFKNIENIEVETGGFFAIPFTGCLRHLVISSQNINISAVHDGQNLEPCL